MMKTLVYITCLVQIGMLAAFSISQREALFTPKDSGRSYIKIKDCVTMESLPGDYEYISSGHDGVCGFYVIGEADELVELIFDDVRINCEKGGLLAVVDGWEAHTEFFPGDWDTKKTFDERYKTYCGASAPPGFLASQNVALMQFRVPLKGQGIKFRVRFHTNTHPCNVISQLDEGVYTLTNYGENINCSLSLLSAQHVTILATDVGSSSQMRPRKDRRDLMKECSGQDRVELLDGSGLDPSYMWQEATVCGHDAKPAARGFYLACPHSVVRLVSSGRRYNSITFRFRPITKGERKLLGYMDC